MRPAGLVVVLACAGVAAARADDATGDATGPAADAPQAVPYRPSVSTPAALSAPGWVEVEAGLAHAGTGHGGHRQGLPYTLKLAFTPDWGVRIGGEAYARQRGGGERGHGFGDTGVVLKRRIAVDDDHAFGVEVGALFPTGRRAVSSGSGKPDYGITGVYSADLGDWHTDLNLNATRLGAPEAGASRTSWLYAAALSRSFGERWGAVAEISGTRQRGAGDTRQLLGALSFAVDRRLVLDAGAARSLRSGPALWQAFAGFTWTALRLF